MRYLILLKGQDKCDVNMTYQPNNNEATLLLKSVLELIL